VAAISSDKKKRSGTKERASSAITQPSDVILDILKKPYYANIPCKSNTVVCLMITTLVVEISEWEGEGEVMMFLT
jgi:hypothetical protein